MIGFFNVNKPSGITSNAVVTAIKKKFHIKKVGHMGTLDPLASGILPIAIGKATRLFDYMLAKSKEYIAEFEFGIETDTLDITGNITNKSFVNFSFDDLQKAINSMIGKNMQMPPKFSAKNINGKRAYDLARRGEEFELNPKEIEIYEFELLEKTGINKYTFRIKCSSGTYIRSIGRDLAKILNTFATMTKLTRTNMEFFKLSDSITLDELLSSNNFDCLISPLQVLNKFDIINIDYDTYKRLIDGKFVDFRQIKNNSFVLYNKKLIGVAKPRQNQLKIDTYLEENDD